MPLIYLLLIIAEVELALILFVLLTARNEARSHHRDAALQRHTLHVQNRTQPPVVLHQAAHGPHGPVR